VAAGSLLQMAADRSELPGSGTPQEFRVGSNSRPFSPRSKRPRVSFATVTQRTFASGCEDPTNLSSPQERLLSPLLEPSIISDKSGIDQHDGAYNEEDSTAELRFPNIDDLCKMTPEHSRGRRNSLTGELGQMQKQMARALGPSPSPGNHEHAEVVYGNPRHDELKPEAEATATTVTTASLPFATSELQQGPTSPDSSEASGEGQSTGEVTANVVSLTKLLLLDESDAANAEASSVGEHSRKLPNTLPNVPTRNLADCQTGWETAQTESSDDLQTAAEASGDSCQGTPCASRVPPIEASPYQDLYAEFKRTAPMLETPVAATGSLSEEAEAEEEKKTVECKHGWHREAAENTVDMAALLAKIGPAGPSPGEGSMVLEGRKSFIELASGKDDGCLSPGGIHEFNSDESFATEGIDFERLNREFNVRAAEYSPREESDCGIAGLEVCGNARQTSPGTPDVTAVPGLNLLANLGVSDMPALQHCDSAASAAVEQSIGVESVLQNSFVSNDSTPLPAASSLQPILSNLEFGNSKSDRQISWADFLSQCDIGFGSAPHASRRGVTGAAAKPKRNEYDQLAATESRSMDSEAQSQLQDLMRCWNHAGNHPPCLVELLHAAELHSRADFLERLRCCQHACKDRAWLQWSEAKNKWFREHTNVHRSATVELQSILGSKCESRKHLEQFLKQLRSRQQHQQQTAAVQHNGFWASSRDMGNDIHEHYEFMGQPVSRAQEAYDLDREKIEQLEGRVEQVRRALMAARQNNSSRKRRFLLQRTQRVALQRQQYVRTCFTHQKTPKGVDFFLRGGAMASVEPWGNSKARISEDLVCTRLRLPPERKERKEGSTQSRRRLSSCLDHEQELVQSLLMYTWQSVFAMLPKASLTHPEKAAVLEAVLPRAEMPRLLSQLNASVLRIFEQVEVLSKLRQEHQEVSRIEPRLHDAGRLGLIVTLISVRSHKVDIKGISSLHHGSRRNQVDASKLTLKFNWHLAGFPESDSIDWSSICVHQVFGREGDVPAVERALQQVSGIGGNRGRSVEQALIAAVKALKHEIRAYPPAGSRS